MFSDNIATYAWKRITWNIAINKKERWYSSKYSSHLVQGTRQILQMHTKTSQRSSLKFEPQRQPPLLHGIIG
ncbi:hypothetical protein Leryth_014377 [Lithospermum erythrorhizon]|nr:hypothetical protein Leryth_014377 [Lithospermum erythrorhizon]